MAMKRLPDRFNLPPKLENARNVIDVTPPVAGAPLTVRDGEWSAEQQETVSYFSAKALVSIPAFSLVTIGAGGVSVATGQVVHGIALAAVASGAEGRFLRQGTVSISSLGLSANSILYVSENGVLTTNADKGVAIGYTLDTGKASFFFGGAGGGGGGSGGGGVDFEPDGKDLYFDDDGILRLRTTVTFSPDTVVSTDATGKLDSSLLPSKNLFSGMQVKYLVPEGTTWDREPEKHVVSADLPNPLTGRKQLVLRSPFGSRPATAEVFVKNKNGVWVRISSMRTTNEYSGVGVTCNGDGNVYVSTGTYLFDDASGSVAPTGPGSNTSNEVVIALYCQTTEVVATHIVGNKRKYLIAPGSSWDKGDPEDYIELPDMPLKFSGGVIKQYKWASPFGSELVHSEAWVKFAGVWRRCEEIIYNGMNNERYGIRSAIPGDGFVHANFSDVPQNADVTVLTETIPVGTSGTGGKTYKNYELCIIVDVPEEVELPTISAKDIHESVQYGDWVDISDIAPITTTLTTAAWVAPASGFLRGWKPNSDNTDLVIKLSDGSVVWRATTTSPQTGGIIPVVVGETYRLGRTAATNKFYFQAIAYDETKYALYSQTGGGQVNPEDAIRIGEIRNYSRYDSEIAENPAFLAIPVATEIDTASYPDFAALVGYTGRYPIPAADYCGAQSIPYIYLGKYTGDTLPELLRSDISVGPGYDDARIAFVVDDDGLEISVPLVTVGAADTPLGSPALLFDVEGAAEPMDLRLRASDQLSATPDPMEMLVRYTPRDK